MVYNATYQRTFIEALKAENFDGARDALESMPSSRDYEERMEKATVLVLGNRVLSKSLMDQYDVNSGELSDKLDELNRVWEGTSRIPEI